MIRERLLAVRERRARLIAKAEGEREAVLATVKRVEAAAAWVDRGRALLRSAREHMVWIAGGVALLVALRPRKALALVLKAYSLWRSWRTLRAMLDRYVPSQAPARRAY